MGKSRTRLLLTGFSPDQNISGTVIARSDFTILYAFSIFFNEDFIIPHFAFDDFRREYHGIDAVNFILSSGERYPRADVYGRRVMAAKADELFMKEVDIAGGIKTFAYARPDASLPVSRLDSIVWVSHLYASWQVIAAPDEYTPLFQNHLRHFGLNPSQISSLESLIKDT